LPDVRGPLRPAETWSAGIGASLLTSGSAAGAAIADRAALGGAIDGLRPRCARRARDVVDVVEGRGGLPEGSLMVERGMEGNAGGLGGLQAFE